MKKSLLAIVFAAASLPLIFAQSTPANQSQPAKTTSATKKAKKAPKVSKHSKTSKKETGTSATQK